MKTIVVPESFIRDLLDSNLKLDKWKGEPIRLTSIEYPNHYLELPIPKF